MSKIATILTALATLSDEDRMALVGALASGDAPKNDADAAPAPVKPSTRPDPRAVARDIVRSILKAGKIWARRQWWTPRLCDWAGHLVTDRRGTYLFALTCAKEDASVLLCKKVALDANGMPSGAVYGQTVVRVDSELTDLGPYTDVRADSSAITSGTSPEPRKVRKPAESQPNPPAAQAAPAPAPEAKSSESLEIPAGATHLVVVEADGSDARFTTNGERVRLYLGGKAAKRILAGSHKVWNADGRTFYFDCGGERC